MAESRVTFAIIEAAETTGIIPVCVMLALYLLKERIFFADGEFPSSFSAIRSEIKYPNLFWLVSQQSTKARSKSSLESTFAITFASR